MSNYFSLYWEALELFNNPVPLFKLAVELNTAIFRDPFESPTRDWSSTIRFLIVMGVMAYITIRVRTWFGKQIDRIIWDERRDRECSYCRSPCKKFMQLGRRDILGRLIEAKTPIDLWYDVRMLSMRDGVQSKADIIKNKRPRWRGFNSLKSDETERCIKMFFEMGRTSVLRELKEKLGKEDKGKVDLDEWAEILRRCREEDMDEVVERVKPPEYVAQEREGDEAREPLGRPPLYYL